MVFIIPLTASFVRNCTENSIRLVGGSSPLEGNVEVCVNGDWGTVNHRRWDHLDASVTCRQLNFSSLGTILLASSTSLFKYIALYSVSNLRVKCLVTALQQAFTR